MIKCLESAIKITTNPFASTLFLLRAIFNFADLNFNFDKKKQNLLDCLVFGLVRFSKVVDA